MTRKKFSTNYANTKKTQFKFLSVTENGKTVSRYNESLLTPLKSNCILEALRGSLMYNDDGYVSSFSSKCFFNLFNEFFDKEYGHCVPFPEIKFYLVP